MNKLPSAKRAQILQMMVESVSIRAISRMTGASKNTIVKLLADAGNACADYQDKNLRGLTCKRLQVDEIWSFVYAKAKAKNVPTAKAASEGAGDVWTWTAICADTKLIPSFHVGSRDAVDANIFIRDVAVRLAHRIQLTCDGHKSYLDAVERAFGDDIDYAMLVKHYGAAKGEDQRRYSPAECIGMAKGVFPGRPDTKHVSTSYAELQNLSMRMGIRRFTRLTNAFSKKVENHCHALAIYFMHYNYIRIHQTLRVTPAMAAGASKTPWTMDDIVRVVEAWETAERE